VFNDRTERFIRVVLDVLSQDLRPPIAGQCLVDQARKRRIIENSAGLVPAPPGEEGIARDGRTSGMLQALAPASFFDRNGGWTLTVVPARADNSRANERKAVEKCRRMEKMGSGRPGRASTARSREDSLPPPGQIAQALGITQGAVRYRLPALSGAAPGTVGHYHIDGKVTVPGGELSKHNSGHDQCSHPHTVNLRERVKVTA
jgi:hypothetical protein